MENDESSPIPMAFDDLLYKPFKETKIFGKIEKHLGVQFVYLPFRGPAAEAEQGRAKEALTPAAPAVFLMEWLKEFSQTLKKGRSKQLLELIDQISAEYSDLARALRDMVCIHQIDQLIPLVAEDRKEKANG